MPNLEDDEPITVYTFNQSDRDYLTALNTAILNLARHTHQGDGAGDPIHGVDGIQTETITGGAGGSIAPNSITAYNLAVGALGIEPFDAGASVQWRNYADDAYLNAIRAANDANDTLEFLLKVSAFQYQYNTNFQATNSGGNAVNLWKYDSSNHWSFLQDIYTQHILPALDGTYDIGDGTHNIRNCYGEQYHFRDESFGGAYVTLKAPAALGGNITLLLPSSIGSSGQYLKSNGDNSTVWATIPTYKQVKQVVYTNLTTQTELTTPAIPFDDTIPQNTEGTEVFTRAITPTNSSNLLVIEVVVHAGHKTADGPIVLALFQDSTADALATSVGQSIYAGGNVVYPRAFRLRYVMAAGTTSATTFKIRIGGAGSNININGGYNAGGAAVRYYGGVLVSSFTITEVEP